MLDQQLGIVVDRWQSAADESSVRQQKHGARRRDIQETTCHGRMLNRQIGEFRNQVALARLFASLPIDLEDGAN